MAAALADGETVMENCAREPEVADLADLLIKMGANIEGAGTSTIRVNGVDRLHGAKHRIIPDRIEAATFIIAGALTGGDLIVTDLVPAHQTALLQSSNSRRHFHVNGESIRVMGDNPLKAADMITEEYPGFPTDVQAQYMALATQAEGTSHHHREYFREPLHARPGTAAHGSQHQDRRQPRHRARQDSAERRRRAGSDLRASASLVLAALVAEGETIIDRVYHIDRGYEHIEEKLRAIGAQIRRIGEILPRRVGA